MLNDDILPRFVAFLKIRTPRMVCPALSLKPQKRGDPPKMVVVLVFSFHKPKKRGTQERHVHNHVSGPWFSLATSGPKLSASRPKV